jgi:PAS domain S-box-containing protein
VALRGSVLIVDDDSVSRRVLTETLSAQGLDCITAASGAEALSLLERKPLSLVLLDLMMPDPDGYAVLRHIRARSDLAELPVVVLTALDSDEEIRRVFASGADDYVHKPFRTAELVARIASQIQIREYVDRLSRRERDSQAIVELSQTLALTLDVRDILFKVTQRVAEVARVDRCSIVLVGAHENVGHVVASSDDPQLRDLQIDLEKYPEIRQVLATGRPLSIQDASRHPLLEVVRQAEPGLEFTSLSLVPILYERRAMGVIFLRSRTHTDFGDYEMALVHMVANATAIALRNAQILQSLRDETQQSTVARVEAERRVQLFQRYADFFESAADGMIVIDASGKVLFTNPRAREITGYGETELVGVSLQDLLAESESERVGRLLRGFNQGVYPRGVDLLVRSSRGEQITISVSFSSVLQEGSAVLCTFRDVTLERRTSIELKQTKEFLERVIDSSVDGILSADLQGRILLFNRAACRILGYSPGEVVGRLSLEALYPQGVARKVAQQISDPAVSGHGRLESYRVDMLNKAGVPIPVTLSAALIMDNRRPVGSVAVFTDIRERLRMEARLQKAQAQLQTREKQVIVAELAGGAAHELNQPLTSVIGYAELLLRHHEEGSVQHRAAAVIINEAERMAEIVRKIGKITKYETKTYVGGAKILDLERASESSEDSEDSEPEGKPE